MLAECGLLFFMDFQKEKYPNITSDLDVALMATSYVAFVWEFLPLGTSLRNTPLALDA
ncbi:MULTISPECIES: hypothetical protein [unclassified Coleofasciculus]|uniref:hypothetical protein n=1 Tax=unclassified Coleofasciculus TaxID=2692782 RepID=UPI00187EF0F5|nr:MULTISPECIES: hypothetical protein [unclassified Coleofasciculus]MBE9127811.1 hypothetical protein [Coleofasciculus sp. LEGE 07081]MBE9149436.1 hypothetical protein [Coleofasciculus sp. LEGE 07092]